MNCAELRGDREEIDNHQAQNEYENWGDDEYQVNWGARLVMYGAQVRRMIPQVI